MVVFTTSVTTAPGVNEAEQVVPQEMGRLLKDPEPTTETASDPALLLSIVKATRVLVGVPMVTGANEPTAATAPPSGRSENAFTVTCERRPGSQSVTQLAASQLVTHDPSLTASPPLRLPRLAFATATKRPPPYATPVHVLGVPLRCGTHVVPSALVSTLTPPCPEPTATYCPSP